MSQQNSEPPTSGGGPDAASLQRQVAGLKDQVEVLRGLQARARRQSLLVGVAVLAAIAIWVLATRSRIEDNFTDQQMNEAMSREAPQLIKLIMPRMQRAIADVGPSVQKDAMDRLHKIEPALANRAYVRLSRMPQTAGQIMADAIGSAFEQAAFRAEPDLQKSASRLSETQRRDLLMTHFHQQVQDYTPQIAKHTQMLFSADTEHFHSLLTKFDLPNAQDDQDLDAVERDFRHQLLMVLDESLQGAAGDVELGQESAPAPARAAP